MSRLTFLAAGAIGMALLSATPAGAATAPPPPVGATTVTCGPSGLQSGLLTKVCAEITGTTVQLYGQISLAGPPSPGGPAPTPKLLDATLAGNIAGGDSLGTVHQSILFNNQTVQVRSLIATVPCGSTVHASLAVASYPWTNTPVTLDVPLPC